MTGRWGMCGPLLTLVPVHCFTTARIRWTTLSTSRRRNPSWYRAFSAMNLLPIRVVGEWLSVKDGVVIFINCIPTRKESLSDVTIAGTTGQIHFCELRGIWEYGPLVEASGGYGARYDFEPLPDMPETLILDDYFYSAAREAVDCLY